MTMQRPMLRTEQGGRAERSAGDALQAGRLTARRRAPELDGQEEMGPPLGWVSLDAPRGLLVCHEPALEARQFLGTIVESRVVRVMKERDEKDREGAVLCASSNRLTADVGRPGRECAACEEKGAFCFPRWWIAWHWGEGSQVFAHTLSRTGTLNFTRYAARLKREGLTPGQVTTRLFVEDACRQTAGAIRRHIQFEQVAFEDEPFAGN